MERFRDWLKGAWTTVKNVGSTIRGFIGKAAPMIPNVGCFMNYLPGSLGSIGETINKLAGAVNSFTGMLPSGMREKVEQYTGKGSISGNIAMQWIS
ncbi:MAG: hypothetical protein Ta2E_12280 [Mycoplasmoidaceae bacterium]|nr:MAG: hypothetical protein Ta2E_12280 [Mycoplasmoidaceae bacterium]